MLNSSYYTIINTFAGSGDGTGYEPSNPFQFFMLLATALIFVGLSALFIWLYWRYKGQASLYAQKYAHRKSGSFQGFWGRNRHRIIGFMAAIFIMIAFFLLMIAFFGVLPYTTWQ